MKLPWEDGNEEEEDFHGDCYLSFNGVFVGGGLSSHVWRENIV